MRNVLLAVALAVVVLSQADADTFGTKKRTPKPSEYGNVVIDNHAARDDSDPILFPHWLHRAKYTCRLCHVDLGFSMIAGETGIADEDNPGDNLSPADLRGMLTVALVADLFGVPVEQVARDVQYYRHVGDGE